MGGGEGDRFSDHRCMCNPHLLGDDLCCFSGLNPLKERQDVAVFECSAKFGWATRGVVCTVHCECAVLARVGASTANGEDVIRLHFHACGDSGSLLHFRTAYPEYDDAVLLIGGGPENDIAAGLKAQITVSGLTLLNRKYSTLSIY